MKRKNIQWHIPTAMFQTKHANQNDFEASGFRFFSETFSSGRLVFISIII